MIKYVIIEHDGHAVYAVEQIDHAATPFTECENCSTQADFRVRALDGGLYGACGEMNYCTDCVEAQRDNAMDEQWIATNFAD